MVLAAWPIHDTEDVRVLITVFKLQLDKFHTAEKDFKSAIKSGKEIAIAQMSAEYMAALDIVRATMKKLNGMGKHIGDSIWLEIKQ